MYTQNLSFSSLMHFITVNAFSISSTQTSTTSRQVVPSNDGGPDLLNSIIILFQSFRQRRRRRRWGGACAWCYLCSCTNPTISDINSNITPWFSAVFIPQSAGTSFAFSVGTSLAVDAYLSSLATLLLAALQGGILHGNPIRVNAIASLYKLNNDLANVKLKKGVIAQNFKLGSSIQDTKIKFNLALILLRFVTPRAQSRSSMPINDHILRRARPSEHVRLQNLSQNRR